MTATSLETPTITSNELTAKVLELAQSFPNAVYHKSTPKCSYIHGRVEGTYFSGCIFGIALRELGVPREFFERLEKDGSAPGIFRIATRLRIPFNAMWRTVQHLQDEGFPWGMATQELTEWVPE